VVLLVQPEVTHAGYPAIQRKMSAKRWLKRHRDSQEIGEPLRVQPALSVHLGLQWYHQDVAKALNEVTVANIVEKLTGRSWSLLTRSRLGPTGSPLLPAGVRRVLFGRTGRGGTMPANLFLAPMGMLFVPESLMLDPGGGGPVSTPRFGSFWRRFSQMYSIAKCRDLLEK
jgi:hypothetical protein